jgi:hypothetical protein
MKRWWNRIPKKLTVLLLAAGVQLLPVSQELREELAKLAMAFLVGQGIADAGKEAVDRQKAHDDGREKQRL